MTNNNAFNVSTAFLYGGLAGLGQSSLMQQECYINAMRQNHGLAALNQTNVPQKKSLLVEDMELDLKEYLYKDVDLT